MFAPLLSIDARAGCSWPVQPIASVEEFDNVRWKDMSGLDLSDRPNLPATLTFNLDTVWPEPNRLPPGCDPCQIMTNAMNPGLGVRALHQQGFTGAGVSTAIIDYIIFQGHPEYAGKIDGFLDLQNHNCSMHGPAVASLLVGENCGTAPDARLYYVAVPQVADANYFAQALDWIVAQNDSLPDSQKIRVVSVSARPSGPYSSYINQQMWDQAYETATAAGILVLDCTEHHGFISRGWYDPNDPENVAKFNTGAPGYLPGFTPGNIHVPASVRTTAEEYDVGAFGYQYCGRGGLSWSIPYCAGVLAMGWQLRPELTPEQMVHSLFQTAYVDDNGAQIINPQQFISFLDANKPSIRVDPEQINFYSIPEAPTSNSQILSISNAGLDTLNWSIDSDCNWLQVGPNTGSSTGWDDVNPVTLQITDIPPAGVHNCELTISDPCAFNNPQTVTVTFYVVGGDGDGDLRHVPSQYATIQAAIDDCNDGDVVVLEPNTYTGPGNRDLDFKGKAITVRTIDPNDPDIVAATIIDCNGTPSENHRGFYFHNNESLNSVLNGLTITRGYMAFGGAILCRHSSPAIRNCVLVNNTSGSGISSAGGAMENEDNSNPILVGCTITANSADNLGGGVRNHTSSPLLFNCLLTGNSATAGGAVHNENSSSNPTLINCTLAGNTAASSGGGIFNYATTSPVLLNCILWANSDGDGVGESAQICRGTPIVDYTCLQGWTGGFGGNGNTGVDPRFADPCNGDCHLKSEAGRWDPGSESWVVDDVTSPCIDKGDPASPVGNEPLPNGGRINMGAYGGTAQASKSLTCWNASACAGQPFGDATCDGNAALADLFALKAAFGSSAPWTDPECCCDFNHDDSVNLGDLFILKAGFGSGPYSPSTGNQTCPP
jgi:hypothetical protein